MRKLYISGPISGRQNGNREAFDMFEDAARQHGWEPVNPQKVDHGHEGECRGQIPVRAEGESEERREGVAHRYGCYMKADIIALMDCDAIVMMPGWRGSKGAILENHIATLCGLDIVRPYEIGIGGMLSS